MSVGILTPCGLSVGYYPHKWLLFAPIGVTKVTVVRWTAEYLTYMYVVSTGWLVSPRRAADVPLQPNSPTDATYPKETAISRTFPRLPVTAA
jgi:hypothetical protein